jgi:hypothetical protein
MEGEAMERTRTSKEPRNTVDLPVESRAAGAIKGGFIIAMVGLANRAKTSDTGTKTMDDQQRLDNFEIQN